jgi:small subunit ribosomal protein S20
MANTKSAAKRARQTARRTLQNKIVMTGIRTQQRKLATALSSGDQAQAQAALQVLASKLDKAAKRGVVHRNLASRRKSRANKAVLKLVTQAKAAAGAQASQGSGSEAGSSPEPSQAPAA